MKVQIIGLGYIGLPTASIIADAGHQVYGYDVSKFAVDSINSGNLHIEEKELDALVARVKNNGNLTVGMDVQDADYHIICVPTPFKRDSSGHIPDISYILNAVKSISPVLKSRDTIILESTSPVGTTERIAKEVKDLRKDLEEDDIFFAYCPERIIPGDMIRELRENDRVIGGLNQESTEKTFSLYRTFVQGKCYTVSAGTAEMVKLTENSFRDVNIAFANELSVICDKSGIDVEEVIFMANHHPRVNILTPGPGVGGHCIAVDPWFIVASNPEDSRLIHTARIVNDDKPNFVIEKVREAVRRSPNSKIYCLGLTYKPNVDDFRESPALRITKELNEEFGKDKVIGVDPYLDSYREEYEGVMNLVDYLNEPEEDSIVLALVHHDEFERIELTNKNYLIDFCGLEKSLNDIKIESKQTSKKTLV